MTNSNQYRISDLIARPPIHLRYEYLSSIGISMCFILSAISAAIGLGIYVLYVNLSYATNASIDARTNALTYWSTISKITTCICALIALLITFSFLFLMFCFKKTKSILTPLQSDLNITNLLTLLSTLIWSILQLSLSSYILAIDCPIFSPTIQAISTLSDIFGGLIMFR